MEDWMLFVLVVIYGLAALFIGYKVGTMKDKERLLVAWDAGWWKKDKNPEAQWEERKNPYWD